MHDQIQSTNDKSWSAKYSQTVTQESWQPVKTRYNLDTKSLKCCSEEHMQGMQSNVSSYYIVQRCICMCTLQKERLVHSQHHAKLLTVGVKWLTVPPPPVGSPTWQKESLHKSWSTTKEPSQQVPVLAYSTQNPTSQKKILYKRWSSLLLPEATFSAWDDSVTYKEIELKRVNG